ncbi:hypothetical protein ACGF13_31395 [Kitasatospora sp. NPDC048286]|uniref:hypothetical protein n=1 Tax=Kitasatospora sp. NPDC048286 TaxID=3364047 RepID=UPI00371F1CD1
MSTFDTWTCPTCGLVNPPGVPCTGCRADPDPATAFHRAPTSTWKTPAPAPAPAPAQAGPTFHPTPAGAAGGPAPTPVPGSPASPLGPPPRASDATRYLCAAVQMDSALARRAIDTVLGEPRRAVASSPDVDLACVLRYAVAARTRHTTTKVLLALIAACIVASFFLHPFEQADAPVPLPGYPGVYTVPRSDPSLLPFDLPVVLVPLLVVAWAVVLIEQLTAYFGVIKPRLSRSAFDPARAPVATRPKEEAQLRELAGLDHRGNVTIFSGFEPFLGYGRLLDTWNFTIPVDRPGEHADRVLPFSIAELTAEITRAVESLGLPGVDVRERIFVSGADLSLGLDPAVRGFLLPWPTKRPSPELPAALVDRLREDGAARARPYLVTTVSGWGSEVVTTSTVRFGLSPAKDVLFVEGASSMLPPVKEAYHLVDHLLDRPTWRQLTALARMSLTSMPGRLVRGTGYVLALPFAPLLARLTDGDQLRQIRHSAFNYGSMASIRQLAADSRFHRYYQQIDHQMYTKVVERRILDSLIDFLEEHQVDISELRERQSVIYNGGIFTSGNARISFVNSPVAAGAGSRVRAMLAPRGPEGGKAKS